MNDSTFNSIYSMSIPEKLSRKEHTRFRSEDDRLDYIQEMYLLLLSIPKDRVKHLLDQNRLADYFAQICINQLFNPKSNFKKKYDYTIFKTEYNTNRNEEEDEL